jgi:hypothetical protein
VEPQGRAEAVLEVVAVQPLQLLDLALEMAATVVILAVVAEVLVA